MYLKASFVSCSAGQDIKVSGSTRCSVARHFASVLESVELRKRLLQVVEVEWSKLSGDARRLTALCLSRVRNASPPWWRPWVTCTSHVTHRRGRVHLMNSS